MVMFWTQSKDINTLMSYMSNRNAVLSIRPDLINYICADTKIPKKLQLYGIFFGAVTFSVENIFPFFWRVLKKSVPDFKCTKYFEKLLKIEKVTGSDIWGKPGFWAIFDFFFIISRDFVRWGPKIRVAGKKKKRGIGDIF